VEAGGMQVPPDKVSKTLSQKQNLKKKCVTQVAVHLYSKHTALVQSPATSLLQKKKNKKQEEAQEEHISLSCSPNNHFI
jgi:hypothetical protein